MSDTLSMLKPYIRVELCNMSYEDLACKYQQNMSDDVLASSYKKVYRLAKSISTKYYNIPEDDIESYCLQKLSYCLSTYNPKVNDSFVSYFCLAYRRALNNIVRSVSKLNSSLFEPLEVLLEEAVYDTYDLIEDILPDNLTSSEKTCCLMLYQGYSVTEISKYLGVSRPTVTTLKKSVGFKINSLQNT